MKINEDFLPKIEYVDYVESTGTTDGWYWRKWHSGFCELFKYVQYSGLTMTTASAGTYYGANGAADKNDTLPFSVTPLFIGSMERSSRASGNYLYWSRINGNKLYSAFRRFASGSNTTCAVEWSIRGLWK